MSQTESGIVERFEGDFAVIEVNGEARDVPRSLVAENVRENDVVEWIGGKWERNDQATRTRSDKIKKLMDSVWED